MDGIEKEYSDRLIVLRVDVTRSENRDIARQFGFQFTPTFIFFDANGREVWRSVGSLNEEQLRMEMGP